MRLTRKQVREATFRAKDMIQRAFKLTDRELLAWAQRILPSVGIEGSRETLLSFIVIDILERSLDHLGSEIPNVQPARHIAPPQPSHKDGQIQLG